MLGNISFEEMNVQGLYLNICAFYWHRDGDVSMDELKKRFKNNTDLIPELTERFLDVDDAGKISIDWLDEQFEERNHLSSVNSKNGSKGGRPKALKTKEKKPNAKKSKSDIKAKETNIEENRIEKNNTEIRIEKKKREFEDRKLKFALTLAPFEKIYGRPMLSDFLKYWTEPNESNSKFRRELEKTWDLERRLETWARNDKNIPKGQEPETVTKSTLTFGK